MKEDRLIDALREVVETPECVGSHARRILFGIGDDAAAWRPSRSHLSIVTTDALVDEVHFLTSSMSPEDIGHRAMRSNLSDIAAMGGRPVLATIALGVPVALSTDFLVRVYHGLAASASRERCRIVGGDVIRTQRLTISITLIGEVSPQRLKRRDGVRPGDVIAVTGPLGASRAGLEVLRGNVPSDRVTASAYAAYARPEPRLAEGRWLAASRRVSAMMDCSDGLSTDLARMARASRCAIRVEHVPIAPVARTVAQRCGADALAYALHGGEDFELIVSMDAHSFEYLSARFRRRFGRPFERIGIAEEGSGVTLVHGKEAFPLTPQGWDSL